MSDLCARPADLIRVPSNKACSWRGVLRGGENHLLAIILAVLVGLPLAEILLRTFLRSGVPGSNSFVQQCTLLIGMNLFLSSYRFNKPLPEVYRSVVPVFFVLLIGVLIITYVPPLTLWLPGLFR